MRVALYSRLPISGRKILRLVNEYATYPTGKSPSVTSAKSIIWNICAFHGGRVGATISQFTSFEGAVAIDDFRALVGPFNNNTLTAAETVAQMLRTF